ncbi:MAG: hypothetical protein AAGE59_36390 [Cyanobacteria bacterium P01_F01_bin.86]
MSRASPSIVMKLPELKRRVKKLWESLNTYKDGVVLTAESFDVVTKRFGDRRYKKTWIKALARFEAAFTYETCMESWTLIAITLNFKPGTAVYEYRHEILDEFLTYPDALDLIKHGLEQLFSSDFSPREREDANGFFRLLEEREGEHRGIGIPARHPWTIQGASAAA